MTWRKTWFSYLLWGLSSILICASFGFLMFDFVKVYHLSTLFIALPVALVLLLYFVTKKCKQSIGPLQISNNYWVTMEGLAFVLLFAGGFLARLYTVTDISETEMFQMCSISVQSTQIQQFAQPVLELFVSFYKNVFYYVGNSWIVAVAVQMNLQLVSFVLLYFVVRKTIGPIGALVSFAFALFSPMCITASVTLDPAVLYFTLCILAVYFIAEGVSRIVKCHKIKWYQYIAVLFIGLFTGSVIYLDILGILVVVFAFTLLLVQKYNSEKKIVKSIPIYYIIYVIGILFGMAGMFLLACKDRFGELKTAFLQWEKTFLPIFGEPLYSSFDITFGIREWVYSGILLCVLLLGILSFFESKQYHPQFASILCVLALLVLRYHSLAALIVERKTFIILTLAVLAGAGIQALLIKETADVEEEESEMIQEEVFEEIPNEIQEEIQNEIQEEIPAEAQEEIQYIPNPLPLPKKHVKKTMNYGFEVEDDKMDFDIEISDDDDFDI